ncbi:hypothetical protein [Aquamicrobium ahrensii]|uniref:Transposase n=1 Tax=Aquamicrobium ahrensii TaxID=469551 RepID=A0ABV2KKH0_9HYPH
MHRPGIFSALVRYVRLAHTRRKEIRTIRMLDSLPAEVRYDIGWPDLHLDGGGRFAHPDSTSDEMPSVIPSRRKGWISPPMPPECPA